MDRNLSELCEDCKENRIKHCSMKFCMNNCGVPLDILAVYERLRTESPLLTLILNRSENKE